MSRMGRIIEAAKQAAMTGIGLEDAMAILNDIEKKENEVTERESKAIAEIEAAIKHAGETIIKESKKRLAEEIYGKENVHERKKVAIIGSSGLYPQMREHFMELHKKGIQGMMVKMDWDGRKIEDIVDTNKKRIREADEVHLFWDGRSPGTILDLGMTIGLNKPLRIMHLEEKSIPEYVKKYAARFLQDPECGYCQEKLTTGNLNMKFCKICRRMYFKGNRTGLWIAASPTQFYPRVGDGSERSD